VTNLTKDELNAELETEPIVDIAIGYPAPKTETDADRVWSQEHPDQVRYSLKLAPGESYTIDWTPILSRRDLYYVAICSSSDSNRLVGSDRQCAPRVLIYYGVEKPEEPMP
jgi:hypothetical protein